MTLQEMRQVLNGGLAFRKGRVQSTAARLEAKCLETLAQLSVKQLRNPWAYTLTKLADVSDDSPTERAASAEKRERQEDETIGRVVLGTALRWLEMYPEIESDIRLRLGDPNLVGYSVLFNAEVIRAFRAAVAVNGGGHPIPLTGDGPSQDGSH